MIQQHLLSPQDSRQQAETSVIMAQINPKEFSWTAPTQNTDGSDIVGNLSYTLTLDGEDFLSFPGALNPDGKFYESTENMNLPDGASSVALKAFDIDKPNLVSKPSGVLEIIVGVVPEAPLDFGAG